MNKKYLNLTRFFYGMAFLLATISTLNRLYIYECYMTYGNQFFASFGEQFTIYSVWKAVHGYPVYEWPQKDWYSLSLYNWLFYYFHGMACRLCHVDEMQIAQTGRIITVLFACLGSLLTFLIAKSLIKGLNLAPNNWIIGIGSLLLWFSPATMGDMTISVRADIPGLALATAGLGVFIWSLRSKISILILSGFLFFLAWSFKQSVIWIFSGCLLYALLTMHWRRTSLFTISFAFPILITLIMGGEIYRYNILYAPSINGIKLINIFMRLPQPALYGCFVYGWILYLPLLVDWKQIRSYGWRRVGDLPISIQQILVLLTVLGPTVCMGILMLGKDGSYSNMLWESFVVLGILAMVSIHHLLASEIRHRRGWLIYASVLFFIPSALMAKNIVLYKRGKLGTLAHLPRSEYEARIDYGEWIKTLPNPLFIRDPLFAFPWYSNGGKYPGILTDLFFYDEAKRKGILEGGGLENLIRKRYFSTLLITPNDDLIETVRQSGYNQIPIPPNRVYLKSSVLDRTDGPLLLFVRTESTAR